QHVPRAALIGELGIEYVAQLGLQARVFDRHQDLDALLEVALHRVCRADVVLGPAAVVEVVDPLVLEEPADDADDLDRARDAVEAGPEPAGVADDEVDRDAALRRAIQRAHDVDVLEAVELPLDVAAAARALQRDLALDLLEQRGLELLGRDQELSVLAARL